MTSTVQLSSKSSQRWPEGSGPLMSVLPPMVILMFVQPVPPMSVTVTSMAARFKYQPEGTAMTISYDAAGGSVGAVVGSCVGVSVGVSVGSCVGVSVGMSVGFCTGVSDMGGSLSSDTTSPKSSSMLAISAGSSRMIVPLAVCGSTMPLSAIAAKEKAAHSSSGRSRISAIRRVTSFSCFLIHRPPNH